MNEVDLRKWLLERNPNKKVVSDCISRLKKIERELNYCDIDREYDKDRCQYILELFSKSGRKLDLNQYPDANFPIGKTSIYNYRLALRKYIQFRDESIKKTTS